MCRLFSSPLMTYRLTFHVKPQSMADPLDRGEPQKLQRS